MACLAKGFTFIMPPILLRSSSTKDGETFSFVVATSNTPPSYIPEIQKSCSQVFCYDIVNETAPLSIALVSKLHLVIGDC